MGEFDKAVQVVREEIAVLAKDCQQNLTSIAEAVLAIEKAIGWKISVTSQERVTFSVRRKGVTPVYDLYVADMAEGVYRRREVGAYPDSDEHPNYLNPEEWDHQKHGCTPEEFAAVFTREVKRALTAKQKIAADLAKAAALVN